VKNSGRGVRDQKRLYPGDAYLHDLGKRLENLIRVGTVSQVDYKAGKARVYFGDITTEDSFEGGWIPFAQINAAHNRSWNPPEMGEQVIVFSPSGNLRNGIIMGAIPQEKFPLEAESPDISKRTYRRKDSALIAGYDEFNRQSGVRRFHIKETGEFRWEIGAKASIIINGDSIQIRAGKTQLVVENGKISVLSDNNTASVVLTETGISSQAGDASLTPAPFVTSKAPDPSKGNPPSMPT
jgi:phage baseplate assembly protein V